MDESFRMTTQTAKLILGNRCISANGGLRTVQALNTPAALIDLQRLKANTRLMSARASSLGVRLRPHVKTHKCVEAAKYQIQNHFGGITVSTLAEAGSFASAGFTDITYAVPLAPGRAVKSVELSSQIKHFQVIVDNTTAIKALSKALKEIGGVINVLLKIDCGYGRAGLRPKDPRVIELAQLIHHEPQMQFLGVLAHGGHAYNCHGPMAIATIAEEERLAAVVAADLIRNAEIPVLEVSVGSTPTAMHAVHLDGVTELRPGNYALFDLFQAEIGACDINQVALSVLTEVIGVYPDRNHMIIDAGALALSKDTGATHIHPETHFGMICDLNLNPIRGLSLVGLSQEHGKVHITQHYVGPIPTVGTRLRILPNHSCLVTALHERLMVVEDGKLCDTWWPVRGW